MTKREMVDYINNAKQDKVIRRLMKFRKVKEVNESMSKVVITIAYKSVKQIKEELGFIEGGKFLTSEEKKRRQKIHLMIYGKKEFECDRRQVIPQRQVISQEPTKRSLRKVIAKSHLTGEEYTFYTRSFMSSLGLIFVKENGEKTFEIPYLDLKKGDIFLKRHYYENNTYNYVLDSFLGITSLRSDNDKAIFEEPYEVIRVEDKPQNYLVYQIINDIDDIKYFGITNNYKQRYYSHFKQQKDNKILYRHMKEVGIEHFKMEILYDNIPTKRLAEKIETILIIGNIGSVSNEQLSCQKWYDGHNTLNDIKGDYILSWFSISDKEDEFFIYYHNYLHTNYINFMSFEELSKEEIISNNLKDLGLSNFDIDNVLSHDRNNVVLKIKKFF